MGAMYSEGQCIMGDGHRQTLVDRQTHISENITFPQLRWRPVKTIWYFDIRTLTSGLCLLTPRSRSRLQLDVLYSMYSSPIMQRT